jgi:hypothetical protein
MKGRAAGDKASGRLSREEFMNNIPKGERMRILADPEKFEELAKTQYITL